ncbi:O-antigen ligase family protein [Nitrospira sp. Kam-Ns4a]
MDTVRIGPVEMVLVLLLAVGLGIGITVGKSALLVGTVAGTALMITAFLSPPLSLYLLVYSMLLGPEFVFGGEFQGAAAGGKAIKVGHGMTLRLDDLLLVVVGLIWLVKAAIRKDEPPFRYTPLNGPIFLYVAACGLATLVGVLVGRVRPLPGFFFNLKYFEYFFLYFMVINIVRTRTMARGLITASLITCFIVSLIAIGQIPSGERASAPFEGEEGEPNTLGGYLVFMGCIVTGLLLTPDSTPKRWPYITTLVLGVLALLATLSRSSFLAATVVLLVVALKTSYRRPLLFSLILLVIVASPWWVPQAVKERVFFTFTQAPTEVGQIRVGGLRVDTSTSDRLRSWKDAMNSLKESPLFGAGVTGAKRFMDAMIPRIVMETGLLGLATFVLLMWAIFRVGWRGYAEAKDAYERGIALGFLLGFLALLIHSVGSNTFIIVRIMEPFWLFAALVVKMQMLPLEEPEPESERAEQPAAIPALQGLRPGLGIGRGTHRL